MFEKEAEEYFETECLHSYADTEEQLKEDVVPAFQKGAEFGYNKAKEEMQKNGLALQSDKDMAETDLATVAYMQGAERYKPKWHKVKSGDLPPEDTKVLAFMAGGEVCIAHFYRKNVWDKIGIVIAWCEIPTYKEK